MLDGLIVRNIFLGESIVIYIAKQTFENLFFRHKSNEKISFFIPRFKEVGNAEGRSDDPRTRTDRDNFEHA